MHEKSHDCENIWIYWWNVNRVTDRVIGSTDHCFVNLLSHPVHYYFIILLFYTVGFTEKLTELTDSTETKCSNVYLYFFLLKSSGHMKALKILFHLVRLQKHICKATLSETKNADITWKIWNLLELSPSDQYNEPVYKLKKSWDKRVIRHEVHRRHRRW